MQIGSFEVPETFTVSAIAIALLLSFATIVGRAACAVMPWRMRAAAKFYFAPCVGLALLVICASALGMRVALGSSALTPLFACGLLGVALATERDTRQLSKHVGAVVLFGLACGAGMLAPALVLGGFDAHNDAFTYLAHSAWLQDHAFSNRILVDEVTPFSSQVFLYQQAGLRMGASFLLAFCQDLLNQEHAYRLYPGVASTAVAACCLAAGGPLLRIMRGIRRPWRMGVLALPALAAGGLAAGAANGFFAQTYGLGFASGTAFLSGMVFAWMLKDTRAPGMIVKSAIPLGILVAALGYAYPEMAPFVLFGLCVGALFVLVRARRTSDVVILGAATALVSALLLNQEVIRAISAIRMQSDVVVGAAVDWPVLGFSSHALGFYGGDSQQPFAHSSALASFMSPAGFGALATAIGIVAIAFAFGRCASRGALVTAVPTIAILGAMIVAFAYFRWGVASPFPSGTGQSWSQYKLSEWANPFLSLLMVAAIGLALRMSALGKAGRSAVIALLFVAGLTWAVPFGLHRVAPVSGYYGNTKDIGGYLERFERLVKTTCGPGQRVYAAMPSRFDKFRQIMALYLPARIVASDWSDDPFVGQWLPDAVESARLAPGDCIVQASPAPILTSGNAVLGPFLVSTGPVLGELAVARVSGAYPAESDSSSTWRWVEQQMSVEVEPHLVSPTATRTRIRFESATSAGQRLLLTVASKGGSKRQFVLPSNGFPPKAFDSTLDVNPADVVSLTFSSPDASVSLGPADPRKGAFLIRNLELIPVVLPP
jgi:hypothetical protein